MNAETPPIAPIADAGARPPLAGGAVSAALRGQLHDKPVPELLGEVHRGRLTGALMLWREPVRKIIYFRDGNPESVKSNLPSERLGRVMVRERMISETDCEESLRRMKASGRQQGSALVEMGCISPQNLRYALRIQLRTKLWELFRWDEGEYQFTRVDPPPVTVPLQLGAFEMIYEGIKRGFDPSRLARVTGEIGPLCVCPSQDGTAALRDAGLGAEELRVWRAIDGARTVAVLGTLGHLPPHETTALVWALRCAGLVELKDPSAIPPPLPRRAPPPPPPLKKRSPAPPAGTLLPELSGDLWSGSSEASAERDLLAARLEAMRQQDHFKILGISRNAAPMDVKQAHAALAEQYAAGAYASSPFEVRQLAAQISQLIDTAYRTLSDPRARAAYARELSSAARGPFNGDVGKLVAAEGRFRKGEELMRRKLYPEAREQFEQAVRLYPQEGVFHAWLGWATFQSAPTSREVIAAALEELEEAIRLSPRSETGYLFAGYVHRAAGNPDSARRQFEKALQCNPACVEALQELRGGRP